MDITHNCCGNGFQFLERALEASGNDLDSTIKSLNNLHLESAETNLSSAFIESGSGISPNIQLVTEGMTHLDWY